jgi:hypothetical protein
MTWCADEPITTANFQACRSSKRQWKDLKNEIKRLQDAGIDPSKINGPGVYYSERPNGK